MFFLFFLLTADTLDIESIFEPDSLIIYLNLIWSFHRPDTLAFKVTHMNCHAGSGREALAPHNPS